MTAPPLVEIRNLSRIYKTRRLFGPVQVTHALDDVSLQITAGQIFGLVGESGCGKSTLARLVAALDQPSAGKVLFEGTDLFALPVSGLKPMRRSFQMIFQDPYGSFDPRQRVGRIVAEPLHVLEQRPGRTEEKDRVGAILAAVGLPAGAADRYPHEFSGGQRQRIAIARALITVPKLVIADEPVSALDLSVQAQVLNLIMDLREKRGVGFLFISHSLAVVDCIADVVGVMYRGRVVEIGPAGMLFDQPLHPYSRKLRDASPSIHKLGRPAVERLVRPDGPGDMSKGCPYAGRCPLVMKRCLTERPQLRTVAAGRSVACHAI